MIVVLITMLHKSALALFLLGLTHAVKFPSEWGTPCKLGPELNACLKDGGFKAIQALINGNPSLGVFPLDPLHIERLDIDQGTGPVSISLNLQDTDILGIKDIVLLDVKNDWKELKVKLSVPTVRIKGKYVVKGKVLVLPITGSGDCEIGFDDFKAVGSVQFTNEIVNGKPYYHMEKVHFTFDPKHATLKFDNLFNGDQALGKQMNIFLNENWKEVVEELKPAIARSFGAAIKEIGNRIFSKIPADVITPS